MQIKSLPAQQREGSKESVLGKKGKEEWTIKR